MVEWKQAVRGDFFDIKLLLQPDVLFDSELSGRKFSSLAPPGAEKGNILFFYNMTSLVGMSVFSHFFGSIEPFPISSFFKNRELYVYVHIYVI